MFRTAALLQFRRFPPPLSNSQSALLQYQQAQSVLGAAGSFYAARCLWPNALRQMLIAKCLQNSLSKMPTPKWTQPSPKLDTHSQIPEAKCPWPATERFVPRHYYNSNTSHLRWAIPIAHNYNISKHKQFLPQLGRFSTAKELWPNAPAQNAHSQMPTAQFA